MSAAADLTTMIEEEKKSQDSTSQKDVDAVLWSDDPENAYFQQMMNEKGGEDSTLGNSAFDQMHNSRERTNTEDDSMFRSDPNAPFRLAILGPEDDLSTMAGDTISGSVVTEGAVFSNANLPAVISSKNPSRNEPVQRDFKEYELKTPVKQKKRRWYPYMRREEDEDTQPESPPAAICISDKDKVVQIDGEIQEKDGDASTYVTYTRPSKRIFVCAAAMGAVLILLIGGLAIAYIQVNNDENSDSSSSSSTALEQPVGGFKPEDFAPTVPVSVPAPTDDYTTTPASLGPTPAPAVVPTKAPVPVPVTEQANLVNVLANNGVDVTNLLDEMESPQYRALRWLASDPSYYDYTEPRLVQRWVLAVVALGMYNDESKTNTAASVLPQWLDYDINECEWFTTSIQTVCTGFGYYRQLELRDQQFYGTIPTELGLLSNSLVFVDFRGSHLEGTLPTELGNLSNLERFHITINKITGTIPTEIGRLTSLEVFSVGRNQLTGPIPSELGLVPNLSTLGVADNFLNGTIPLELGGLENMLLMILSKNDLTGTIPNELSNLASMKSLEVGYNNLSGQVPSEICSLANLNSLEADCYVVQCDCCTICAATPRPTKMPTAPPTTVTLSTSMPTIAVTPSPTVMPTTCNPFINWVPDCIEIGDPLEVSYQNCDPQFGDWIGIYDKDADPSNLEAPYLWVWACGTQDCRDAPQANTVFLDENAVDNTSGVWPLPRGDYLAYLIRNSGGPYAALLLSDTMKLRDGPC